MSAESGDGLNQHDLPDPPDLHDDDALLVALGQAIDRADPVPPDAVDVARAVFDLGRVDAELAELLFDSLHDEAAVVLMRHDREGQPRTLGFASGGHRVDLELSADGSSLLGQLDPVEEASVTLDSTTGSRVGRADALGRFLFTIEPGSLRLHIVTDDGATIRTPWIVS